MQDSSRDFMNRIQPAIVRRGRYVWRRLARDVRNEKIHSAICLAWGAYVRLVELDRAETIAPSALALYYCRQVNAGRDLGNPVSSREALTANAESGVTVHRGPVAEMLIDPKNAPIPDHVAFTVDFAEFRASLCQRDRKLIAAFAAGTPGIKIAKKLGISTGRVSQLRDELRQRWERFAAC